MLLEMRCVEFSFVDRVELLVVALDLIDQENKSIASEPGGIVLVSIHQISLDS